MKMVVPMKPGSKAAGTLSQMPTAPSSFPVISNRKIKVTDTDHYTYECHMKPFEIWLVEFIDIFYQKN